MAAAHSPFGMPIPEGGIVFGIDLGALVAPSVGELVGEHQRRLIDAVGRYNAAVDAARVLEPHIERAHLMVTIADETPADEAHDASPDIEDDGTCAACGKVH